MPSHAISDLADQREDDVPVRAQPLDQISLVRSGEATNVKRPDCVPVRNGFGPDLQKRPASQKRKDTTRLTRMQVTTGK